MMIGLIIIAGAIIVTVRLKVGGRCYNGGKQHNFHPRYDEKSNGDTVEVKR